MDSANSEYRDPLLKPLGTHSSWLLWEVGGVNGPFFCTQRNKHGIWHGVRIPTLTLTLQELSQMPLTEWQSYAQRHRWLRVPAPLWEVRWLMLLSKGECKGIRSSPNPSCSVLHCILGVQEACWRMDITFLAYSRYCMILALLLVKFEGLAQSKASYDSLDLGQSKLLNVSKH